MREARPLFRCARVRIDQMRNRKAGAQHRPADSIKQKDAACRVIVQLSRKALPNRIAEPASAEPLAFQVQKRDLVQGVVRPQAGVELKTIDDWEWRTEPDVLRPQVAMAIDDEPSGNPLSQQSSTMFEKPSLNGRDT